MATGGGRCPELVMIYFLWGQSADVYTHAIKGWLAGRFREERKMERNCLSEDLKKTFCAWIIKISMCTPINRRLETNVNDPT